MKQEKYSGYWGNRQRNVILLIIITVLIIYIAVPLYGVIQDVKEGGTVFVIEGSGAGDSVLDKLVDFLFESKDVNVPVTYIVDLKGTVLNSDGTPYANGIVELRSTPRYTRTDKNGYFIFRSVETGKHKINVLDESGNTLASCNVNITTDGKKGAPVSTSFSEDTYKINVAVNVKVLHIRLTLNTDENGKVSGISSIEVTKTETASSDQSENPDSGNQTDIGGPGQLEDGSGETPDEPPAVPEPPANGGGTSGGGGGGNPDSKPFQLEVYDSGASTSFGSTAAAQINIFGSEKRIAPGMKGSYRFTVDNTRNSYPSLYTVNFKESDTLPTGQKIPMEFRLKAGNAYVAGDADKWCTEESQLYQDTFLEGSSKVVYTLEWYWPDGVKDNLYTESDKNKEYSYTIRIEVTAQQK